MSKRSSLLNPNPALSRGFADVGPLGPAAGHAGPIEVSTMTLGGTVAKTALLVVLMVAAAVGGWTLLGDSPGAEFGSKVRQMLPESRRWGPGGRGALGSV